MKNEKELFIMLEIPVESLNLFEQLDRNVVAFYRNEEISQTESLNISITQEHYDKKYKELQPLGYQAVQIPLGMALDNVIQQAHFQNLIIGGLLPDEIKVNKGDLMSLKDIVDSFCIMFAAANNRLENSKAYEFMKDKTVFFIGKLLTDDLKNGDEISYMGIERESADGTSYEAVKCFLTKESAEQYNDSKKTSKPSKSSLSASLLG